MTNGQANGRVRIAPLVGLAGQTSGEAVAAALSRKGRAARRSDAPGPADAPGGAGAGVTEGAGAADGLDAGDTDE